ncbi:MAG: Glycosyl transferase, group 1 family protein [Candidatus Woesebacteria bacterium GW2011_GWA1_33_30]|uniref:Glycosyl transferase, group 1 family protein n=1 Tax=Candidatus Woesebacteria bacterium GW2011_GWA2_33_28 TaxID=1618561 RepID=A0A0G0C8G1_9BACT|nr:MAG: Glycosyl transferase, group 1 family protein [Candidatus Woesebacteria bacterium GW2011_GWA2_33_28]KKP48399.1 MAG: Glycosyl transferase, group 1 family protein [Candidatus Woesebacteria bacterium GW2011_GWA1_33_30]KKP49506.1 MAG: Glycosyl transferase, group 1 family protein [Microgenomates group bacterium GW2011_GWC1_33_32]KKP52471.1 MAG: Glycosyl transferase, group 1 family protein [Candidatus Woesebacteria bacterium GW2011_GWB1_33_38]KKP58329.1 MAG: Glycosyl transferase, group 1 famil
MKIVITSNYKIGNETGASFVTDLLANKLSKRHEVLYLCLGEKYRLVKKSKNFSILNIPTFTINGIDLPLITPMVVLSASNELERFNPDIVHTQNSILLSKLAQIWANKNKVPVVTTFHHIPTQALEHLLPQFKKSYLTKIVQDFYTQTSLKGFLAKCDTVISLNKFQYQAIRKVDKKIKLVTINNGLDLRFLWKIKSRQFNLNNDINFVFLGSYNERKNQSYLIDAFKKLPNNYKFFCHGKFETGGNYLKKLNKKIELNEIKNVYLLDYINLDKIYKVFKKSHFFISASKKEVQSLSIIQALASGLPVIGLENETTLELINKDNGLVCPKNITPNKFAVHITNFIKNIDYRSLAINARKSSKRFKIQDVVLKIEKMYKSTINSNG